MSRTSELLLHYRTIILTKVCQKETSAPEKKKMLQNFSSQHLMIVRRYDGRMIDVLGHI